MSFQRALETWRNFYARVPSGGSVIRAPLENNLITKEQVTGPGSGLSPALGRISSGLLTLPPLVRSYFVCAHRQNTLAFSSRLDANRVVRDERDGRTKGRGRG